MKGILKQFHDAHPEVEYPCPSLLPPLITKGSMEDGFAARWRAVCSPAGSGGPLMPQQVTLLASSAYGPGDVEELKEIVEALWPDSHRSA